MIAQILTAALAYSSAPIARTRAPAARAMARMVTLQEIKADSGVSGPFMYFDPAGLMTNEWQLTQYKRYKDCEIKHSRLAMLAVVGFVVGEVFHPLFGGNVDTPSYVAFQATPLQTFFPIVVAAIGLVEFLTSVPTFKNPEDVNNMYMMKDAHVPGDLNFFGGKALMKSDPAKYKDLATKELNNGRVRAPSAAAPLRALPSARARARAPRWLPLC
jgi:hypothetical protein